MSHEQRIIIEITQKLAIALIQVTEYEAMPVHSKEEMGEKEAVSYRLRDSITGLSNELKRIADNFDNKGARLAIMAEAKANVG